MAAVSRVLIVGAGISGALTAALLRKELSHVHISVWEKARGAADPQSGQSVVVHSSVPWGVEHVEESKDDVKPIMLDYVRGLLPNLPDPEFVKGHKWRYSQVRTPFPGSPGCVQLSKDPSLLVGGDGFSYSKFEGCIDSANALVAAVLHH